MRTFAFAVLCAFSTSASAATSQFDLICVGTANSYDDGAKFDGEFKRHFQIDLARGEYCIDGCTTMNRLHEVNSLEIVFRDVPMTGGALNAFKNSEKVDRETGEYKLAMLDAKNLRHMTASATCTPAPFTPFPATKF